MFRREFMWPAQVLELVGSTIHLEKGHPWPNAKMHARSIPIASVSRSTKTDTVASSPHRVRTQWRSETLFHSDWWNKHL